MLGGFQKVEFDFVADNPGLTLFHCHQQLHMDFGFMALFQYAQVNRGNALRQRSPKDNKFAAVKEECSECVLISPDAAPV